VRRTQRIEKYLAALWQPGPTNGRVGALDGVRAVAAAMVFFVHFDAAFGVPLRPAPIAGLTAWAGLYGNFGVDLFFMLSGWLLYGGLQRRPQGYAAFMSRRVRRLYPTFLAVLAIYLVAGLLLPERSKIPADGALPYVLANLLLLPGVFPIVPIISVAWSLSYEMAFYVVLPPICWLLRALALSPRARLGVWGLAVIGHSVVTAWQCAGGRVLMFVAGMALVDLAAVPRLWAIARSWATPVLAAGILAVGLDAVAGWRLGSVPSGFSARLPGCGLAQLLTLMVLASVMLLALDHDNPLARLFQLARVRWFGNISYSYYLVHGLALHVCAAVIGHMIPLAQIPALAVPAVLVVAFGVTTLAAFALYAAVEYPLSVAQQQARVPVA